MTVAELIEQLQKYPSDAEVVYSDSMGIFTDVTGADTEVEYSIFDFSRKIIVKIY